MHLNTMCRQLLLVAGTSGVAMFSVPTMAQTASTEDFKLEEVIVTAEKRVTNLQKTPQSINVIGGNEMVEASITTVNDLQTMVAGLNVQVGGSAFASNGGHDMTIRGVQGQTGGDPSLQPSVASVVDGVYSQQGISGAGGLFDMAQVEVVKGPQGTLIGRNATTGVVSYSTQKATFNNEGNVSLDVGNYSKTNVSGMLNAPLSKTLAIRIAGQSSNHDGYYKDGFSDEKSLGGRFKLLYQPNDHVSLSLNTDYSVQKGKGNGSTTFVAATGDAVGGDPWAGPTTPAWAGSNNQTNYHGKFGQDARNNDVIWTITPQLDWNLGFATSTTLLSYKTSITDEVSNSFSGLHNKSVERSLESRLTSSDEESPRLRWLVGINLYDQVITGTAVTVNGLDASAVGQVTRGGQASDYDFSKAAAATACFGPCSTTAYSLTTGRHNLQKSAALFTQNTYSVTDAVRLTAGLRWQQETAERSGTNTLGYSALGVRDPSGDSTLTAAGSRKFSGVTWRTGIDADVSPNSMVYAMVATGWKAGNPQQFNAPYDLQKPEKMTAFTVGSKNRFLDQRLQVNAEAFLWSYKDRQIQVLMDCSAVSKGQFTLAYLESHGGDPDCSPSFLNQNVMSVFVQTNAPKSHVQGLSLDLSYRPFTSDFFSANVEWLQEAKHDDYGKPADADQCQIDCQAADAPTLSGTVSWRHIFNVSTGRVSFDFRSKFATETLLQVAKSAESLRSLDQEGNIQRAYMMSNVGLSYAPSSVKWNVRGYVDNLENKVVKSFAFSQQSTGTATLLSPRTYGLQLRVDF